MKVLSELVQELKDAIARDKEKISQLKGQISEDKNKLSGLDAKYNELVLQGNDSESDKVFNQLFELKRDIEKNERKLQILNSGQVSENVQRAVQAIFDYVAAEDSKLIKLEKQKDKEVNHLREEYLRKLGEVGSIVRQKRELQRLRRYAEQQLDPSYDPMGLTVKELDYKVHNYLINNRDEVLAAFKG